MRIDQADMPLRRHIAYLVQDQRGVGLFACTSRSQQREMLSQHGVDVERPARVFGGIDSSDLDIGPFVRRINLPHVGTRNRIDLRAGRRVASDTATELVNFARSEEHTSELQSLMRISYAVFCLKK